MAQILGITGAIGSGKTTLSELLQKLEPNSSTYESRQIVTEVAEQFNKALASELSFGVVATDTELINQAIIWLTDSVHDILHREVTWTQLALTPHRLAAHFEYYEKLFEYLAVLKDNPDLAKQRITQENKATYRPLLQWLGGYLVATVGKTVWFDEIFRRIERYDSEKHLVIINGLRYPADAAVVRAHGGLIVEIERPGQTTIDPNDITERERQNITADTLIKNTGSLRDLQTAAEHFWTDYQISQTTPIYEATP